MSNLTSKLGSGLQKAATIGVAAVTGATVAIGSLVAGAVNNFAEYEQLVGGVETLFGDSASTVINYANNAFRTAGLSANNYMSTVTSFSASLLQSLGGNTAEAAEMADMAITDMSDNANKIGSDMASIQNAYQGFAKQNYTMLDNLKLGYGGTKTEMERLLQDADALSESFNLQVDESNKLVYSYADVVEAIHIVQTEMGITGTTAKEASTTISGSVASVKAAWTNLTVEFAKDNGDIEASIEALADTVSTAAGNIVPRVTTTIAAIAQNAPEVIAAFGDLVDEVGQEMPGLWAELKPAIAEGVSGALGIIGIEVESADVEKTIDDLVEGVQGSVSTLKDKLLEITDTVGEKFSKISQTLEENGVTIEDVFAGIQTTIELVAPAVDAAAGAIGEALNVLVDWASTDGSALNTALLNIGTSFATLAGMATHYFTAIEKGLQGDLKGAIDEVGAMYEVWFDGMEEGFGRTAEYADSKMREASNNIGKHKLALPEFDTSSADTAVTYADKKIKEFESGLMAREWVTPPIDTSSADVATDYVDKKLKEFEYGLKTQEWVTPPVDTSPTIGALNELNQHIDSIGRNLATLGTTTFNDNFNAPMSFQSIDGSHSSGLDYVPYNGYIAELHKGEMVVPAAEASYLRSGAGNGEMLGVLYKILSVLMANNDNMGASMREALTNVSLSVNKREFGRIVSATGV